MKEEGTLHRKLGARGLHEALRGPREQNRGWSPRCNSIYVVVRFNDRDRYRKPIRGWFQVLRIQPGCICYVKLRKFPAPRGPATSPRLTNDWHQPLRRVAGRRMRRGCLLSRWPASRLTNCRPLSLFQPCSAILRADGSEKTEKPFWNVVINNSSRVCLLSPRFSRLSLLALLSSCPISVDVCCISSSLLPFAHRLSHRFFAF